MVASPRTERVLELDLLRFVAALVVVLFHYAFRGSAADGMSDLTLPTLAPLAKYGYLGVELFFMISGFVILITASRAGLRHFVASRAARLYPAFWVCCTITALFTVLLGTGRYHVDLVTYLANMTMLHGFVGVDHLDGVYWSLVVELRFYALVGLLVALRLVHRAQWFVVLWLLASAVVPFERGSFVDRTFALRFAPFFCAGVLAFLVRTQGVTPARVLLYLTAWVLAVRHAVTRVPILEAKFGVDFDPAPIAVVVSGCFALLWLVAVGRAGLLATPRLAALGALTYPLYLLHQNVGFMVFNRVGDALDPHVALGLVLAGMVALSWAVHRFVERPGGRTLKLWLERALRVPRARRAECAVRVEAGP